MKWERLQENLCPYCNNGLQDIGDIIRCVSCTFKIDHERFNKIKAVRSRDATCVKLVWQNLGIGYCPMCIKQQVRDGIGKFEYIVCSDANCTFRIRKDKLDILLLDPNHPINKFPSPTHADLVK